MTTTTKTTAEIAAIIVVAYDLPTRSAARKALDDAAVAARHAGDHAAAEAFYQAAFDA